LVFNFLQGGWEKLGERREKLGKRRETLGERREGEVYRVTGNTGISHR
jgi:hypothetical protein